MIQDTRLFDPDKRETRQMRSKETSTDYRYFPEPDLLPVELSEAFIQSVANGMPELPDERLARYQSSLGLSNADARLLSGERPLAQFFDTVANGVDDPKMAANWVKGDLLGKLNETEESIASCPITPEQLIDLIKLIEAGTISGKIAKEFFKRCGLASTSRSRTTSLARVSSKSLMLGHWNRLFKGLSMLILSKPMTSKPGKESSWGFCGPGDEGNIRTGQPSTGQHHYSFLAGSLSAATQTPASHSSITSNRWAALQHSRPSRLVRPAFAAILEAIKKPFDSLRINPQITLTHSRDRTDIDDGSVGFRSNSDDHVVFETEPKGRVCCLNNA